MHYYYKCGNAKRKKGCNKKAVKKDWIERAIVRLTMERVLNEEKINRIIDALLVMQEREDVTIPALRRQLAETEKGIENMLNAIQQGIFTASTKQRLEELEKQKEELSLSMTTAELQKPKLTREYMEHWFSQFRYGDPNDREFQKRLIDTFVNAIFVYDDKLVLTYNYQHGTQTITLKEVEDFLGSDLVGLSPPVRNRLNGSSACQISPIAMQQWGFKHEKSKERKKGCHLWMASFLRFIAANLSLTHAVTAVSPR